MKTRTARNLAIAALFLGMPISVLAGVLKSGYIMCSSEEALDEGIQLVIQRKTDMLRSIGCYPTQDSLEGVVVDRGFMTSRVRIRFPSGDSASVWVPSEAIAK